MHLSESQEKTDGLAIPFGWTIRPLRDLLSAGPKNGYSGRSGTDLRGTPTLALTATTSGRMILSKETVKYLAETIDPRAGIFLRAGDVLVQRSNTLDIVGTTAVFDGPNDVYVYPDLMMRLRFKSRETAKWFWRYANSSSGRRYFVSVAAGSTGSMPKISGDKLNHMPIPLPPIGEQCAVVAVLDDMDVLLEALDQLIAKTRDLKQATMQQLVTGRRRLPGYSDVWVQQQLADIADIRSGGTPSTTDSRFWDGEVAWCTPTDITALSGKKYLQTTVRTITAAGLAASSAEIIPRHSVVMTSRATIGECAINTIPISTNQGFKNFVPKEGTHVEFLYYLLSMQKQAFISLCGGSTFLEIGKGQLSSYAVRLPSTKDEQIAIAAVLSDMDEELTALELRREKTLTLKQAMMQELLTGRTRLV